MCYNAYSFYRVYLMRQRWNQLTKIIKSFLENRSFQIKVGDKISSSREIRAEVPQDSCLSPQLFSIFINDLSRLPDSKTALFANDTLLYASSKTYKCAVKRLQQQINTIQPWYEDWKISVNALKTKAILF